MLLAQLLSSSEPIEELNVAINSLSSDSIINLFKGLQFNNSLRQLKIGDDFAKHPNHISLEAMKTLSEYLQDCEKCKLEVLDLRNCNIQPDTSIEFAHGLHQNVSLKEVLLSHSPIGNEGAITLGQALIRNKTITKLEFVMCDITTEGVAALASSLRTNSTMEWLEISGTYLGKAIPSFAHLLVHNKTLKILYIHDEDYSLSQADVNMLLNSLTSNKTMKKLRLPSRFQVDIDKRVEWW